VLVVKSETSIMRRHIWTWKFVWKYQKLSYIIMFTNIIYVLQNT